MPSRHFTPEKKDFGLNMIMGLYSNEIKNEPLFFGLSNSQNFPKNFIQTLFLNISFKIPPPKKTVLQTCFCSKLRKPISMFALFRTFSKIKSFSMIRLFGPEKNKKRRKSKTSFPKFEWKYVNNTSFWNLEKILSNEI